MWCLLPGKVQCIWLCGVVLRQGLECGPNGPVLGKDPNQKFGEWRLGWVSHYQFCVVRFTEVEACPFLGSPPSKTNRASTQEKVFMWTHPNFYCTIISCTLLSLIYVCILWSCMMSKINCVKTEVSTENGSEVEVSTWDLFEVSTWDRIYGTGLWIDLEV